VQVDDDLAPICAKLNLTAEDASRLHKKFQSIDTDGSGVIDTDEFFAFIQMEKTPFGQKLFALIDENGSGEIDFNEFLVGLWNMCTFDEEALLKFAFQLVDEDDSGYVDNNEIVQMVKSVHGSKFSSKLIPHVKKVMKKFDQNGDGQFSFNEFKNCHKELPLLFMPAFTLKNAMEDEFFGLGFWKHARQARKKDMRAQSIRDFMKLNAECQRVAHPKYSGDGGMQAFKKSKPKRPAWEKSDLDPSRMRVDDIDPAKKEKKTRADKLEDRYAKEDKTGFRRFDLDVNEAKRDRHEVKVERKDRARAYTDEIIKGSKSRQIRENKAKGDYTGPRSKPPAPGSRRDMGKRK